MTQLTQDMMDRRLGRLKFTVFSAHNHTALIRQIFNFLNFVPLDARCNIATGEVEYTGFSTLFDEVEEGDIPPLYEVESNFVGHDIVGADVALSATQDEKEIPRRRIRIR